MILRFVNPTCKFRRRKNLAFNTNPPNTSSPLFDYPLEKSVAHSPLLKNEENQPAQELRGGAHWGEGGNGPGRDRGRARQAPLQQGLRQGHGIS